MRFIFTVMADFVEREGKTEKEVLLFAVSHSRWLPGRLVDMKQGERNIFPDSHEGTYRAQGVSSSSSAFPGHKHGVE